MKLSAVIAGVHKIIATVSTSAGAADAGKVPVLNASGLLDGTMSMVFVQAGAPVDYTDGTPPASFEGVAPKGSLLIDTTNANVYVNAGTLAHQTWKLVTRAA